MSFFAEIRRRKVFQVAAVYAVVAWLIIQIVDVVSEPLNLPETLDTVVIILLAVGFPIAVIVAWAFDVTPEGIRVTGKSQPDIGSPQSSATFTYVVQGLVLAAVGFLILDQYVLSPQSGLETNLIAGGAGDALTSGVPSESPEVSSPVTRTSINLGPLDRLRPLGLRTEIALSVDGRSLVYSSMVDGAYSLVFRAMDDLEPRTLLQLRVSNGYSGTPSFSPDGEWLVFRDGPDLKTASIRGGVPRFLAANSRIGTGAFWAEDGTIFFSSYADSSDLSIHRVYDEGAEEQRVGEAVGRDEEHSWPHLLPRGDALLFTSSPREAARDGRIELLDLGTGEVRTLIYGAYNARYAPSGHIVFIRDEALWAVPFDLESQEIIGEQVPIIAGVETSSDRGTAVYAFSNDGLLVYLPGNDTAASRTDRNLVWVDRDGGEEVLSAPPRTYRWPRIAPDGERFAVNVAEADGGADLWTYSPENGGNLSRRTFTRDAGRPVWMPNGERLIFDSRSENTAIWIVESDGSQQPERIAEVESRDPNPESVSPDGTELTYRAGPNPFDLYVLALDGESTEEQLIATNASEGWSAISPDGRWIAYGSDESGQLEVYVAPFPEVDEGGPWQVSTDGGQEPRWRNDGREIFYVRNRESIVAVSIDASHTAEGSVFTIGPSRTLFSNSALGVIGRPIYDVSPNGQRFLVTKPVEQAISIDDPEEASLVVVHNWFEELVSLAPPSR